MCILQINLKTVYFILTGPMFCKFVCSIQTPYLINFHVCYLLGNSYIPGNPLGPGGPEGPGGPMGPGGPGVNVESRTAVIRAKTFVKKMVCDKHFICYLILYFQINAASLV